MRNDAREIWTIRFTVKFYCCLTGSRALASIFYGTPKVGLKQNPILNQSETRSLKISDLTSKLRQYGLFSF